MSLQVIVRRFLNVSTGYCTKFPHVLQPGYCTKLHNVLQVIAQSYLIFEMLLYKVS